MKEQKVKGTAVARIHVTVEVECAAWGADCTIGQADRQAREEAELKIANLIRNQGMGIVSVKTAFVMFVPDKER